MGKFSNPFSPASCIALSFFFKKSLAEEDRRHLGPKKNSIALGKMQFQDVLRKMHFHAKNIL